MKRVLSIQDISCFGKCSLTVALPIISALGIETAVVPTAVLSTHTQYTGFTFRDLTDDMDPIKAHWKKEGFAFDAIYTGYLGSMRQIDIVMDYFETFRTENTMVIVDPAMADNGKLYVGFDEEFAGHMGRLCGCADIILPNISEACLMTGEPYPGEDADESTVRYLAAKLSSLGAPVSVITGVTLNNGSFGFIGYDSRSKEWFSYGTEKIAQRFHGTGDIFASAFAGVLTRSGDVLEALKTAADYTCACIRRTASDSDHTNHAVNFETEIPYLLRRAGLI